MKQWTREEEELIIELYNNGSSNQEIAAHFKDRDYSSVNNKIKKLRERKTIKPRMEYDYIPEGLLAESILPLTKEELRHDLRNYARAMIKKLRATGKLMGQKVVHIGPNFVTLQGDFYNETYSYYELKEMGIKCN